MRPFQNIHLQRTEGLSKQLFKQYNKKTEKLFNQTPERAGCFFHSQKQINYFCKHPRCTLPMCEQCLSIHRTQHLYRKQIPMQNIISFESSKQFILQQLKMSKLKVKSNHKRLEVQLLKYREKMISILDTTLNNLRAQLLLRDQENSTLKLGEIAQSIRRIQEQNSMNDVICGYQQLYQQLNQGLCQNNSGHSNDSAGRRKNSIIDSIKLVPDQKQLVKVVQRGFLNCKFIKGEEKQQKRTKITKNQYLNILDDLPQLGSQNEKIPISRLESLKTSKKNEQPQRQSQRQPHNSQVQAFDSQRHRIIQVKKQQRRQIFKQDPANSSSQKSPQPNNPTKSPKSLAEQPMFSQVKRYQFQQQAQTPQNIQSRQNIYTKKLNQQQLLKIQQNMLRNKRSNSSLSLTLTNKTSRSSKGKGLTLTKTPSIQQDKLYRVKQKQQVKKIKERLRLRQSGLTGGTNQELAKFSPNAWKRVVNLRDSNQGFRNKSTEKTNSNHGAVLNKNSMSKRNLDVDVLNPMQMRQLLMRKKVEKQVENGSMNNIRITGYPI